MVHTGRMAFSGLYLTERLKPDFTYYITSPIISFVAEVLLYGFGGEGKRHCNHLQILFQEQILFLVCLCACIVCALNLYIF